MTKVRKLILKVERSVNILYIIVCGFAKAVPSQKLMLFGGDLDVEKRGNLWLKMNSNLIPTAGTSHPGN